MRADRRSPMIVAGTAAFLLACAAAQPAMATVHRKEVFLYKTAAGACTHEVDEKRFTLRRSHDVSKWDVSNDGMPHGSNACGAAQYVILCSYTKVNGTYVKNLSAFERCNSVPPSIAPDGMNKAFLLDAGKSVTLMCRGKTDGLTKVVVDSGSAEPTCADTVPDESGQSLRAKSAGDPQKIFYHVIDIEIVP